MSRLSAFVPNAFKSIGTLNKGWGVCGFTSVCYAIYATRPGYRAKIVNATQHYTLLASIKTFLVEMQARGEYTLLNEIETFNRTFPGRQKFTIQEYIQTINEAAAADQRGADIERDSKFGLGMPPKGVAKYLEHVWRYKTQIFGEDTYCPDPGGDAIVGVKSLGSTDLTLYNGLCHWMYRYQGKIYSWGDKFSSIKSAGKKVNRNYELCCVIRIQTS